MPLLAWHLPGRQAGSAGARAGVYVEAGRNLYIGIGAAYESYFDCKNSIYRKCDSTYAEVSFTFAF